MISRLYRAISQDAPEEMAEMVAKYRAEGYTKFQLKVGGEPDTDIARINAVAKKLLPGNVLIADANTGWTAASSAAASPMLVRDVDVYIGSPARVTKKCLAVREHTNRPFILDEVMDGVEMVIRGYTDRAMDIVNLKISKVGGLTKGPANPRSMRLPWNCTDHRRHLGRRYYNGGDRPPGPQHAT